MKTEIEIPIAFADIPTDHSVQFRDTIFYHKIYFSESTRDTVPHIKVPQVNINTYKNIMDIDGKCFVIYYTQTGEEVRKETIMYLN